MADCRQMGSLWTPQEDLLLLRHVAEYGTKRWGHLQESGALPHRDQKACCNRFILLRKKFLQAKLTAQNKEGTHASKQEKTSRSAGAPGRSASDGPSPAWELRAVPQSFKKRSQREAASVISAKGSSPLESPPATFPYVADTVQSVPESVPRQPCGSFSVNPFLGIGGRDLQGEAQAKALDSLSRDGQGSCHGNKAALEQSDPASLLAHAFGVNSANAQGSRLAPRADDATIEQVPLRCRDLQQAATLHSFQRVPSFEDTTRRLAPKSDDDDQASLMASTWTASCEKGKVETLKLNSQHGELQVQCLNKPASLRANKEVIGQSFQVHLPSGSGCTIPPDALLDQIASSPLQMFISRTKAP